MYLGDPRNDILYEKKASSVTDSLALPCHCSHNGQCWGSVCNQGSRCSVRPIWEYDCGPPGRPMPCNNRCSRF